MKYLPIFVALTATSAGSYAQEASKLEEVIVTGSLIEQNLLEVMASADLIDNSELQRLQATDLASVLEYQSLIDITRNGGRASQTSIFTRGTNAGQTLVLINGQRFSSATLGQTSIQFIDPEQIERVEIVNGSQSAIYGSEAIGGVIQIFTDKQSDEFKGFGSVSAGSHSLQRWSLGLSNSLSQLSYSASFSKERSDGIDNLVNDTGFNADKDPYEIAAANLFANYQISEGSTLGFNFVQNTAEADYDTAYSGDESQPFSKTRQSIIGLNFDSSINNLYDTALRLGRSIDDSKEYDRQTEGLGSMFKTTRDSLYWQNQLSFNNAFNLVAGVDYYEESIDSLQDYSYQTEDNQLVIVDQRDNTALFALANLSLDRFDYQLGLRADDSSDFGSHESSSFRAGYRLNDLQKIWISWTEGFKAPSFNDLFWPNSGNKDLKPEESESFEVGYKSFSGNSSSTITLFQTDVKNLIAWAPSAEDPNDWRPANIESAKISGIELAYDLSVDDYLIASNFSLLKTEDANTGEPLLNRASRKLSLNLSRDFTSFSAGVLFKAQGKRYQGFGAYAGGYTSFGLFAAKDYNNGLSVKVKAQNIFDREYQLDQRYNEDGANFVSKITYKFN